jgi:hypothetical protein
MELGRSMMMMDAAPAAPDSDPVRGHRQQIGKSAALTEGGRVDHLRHALRARESGRRDADDLLEPAGRCSGCWPHDGEVDGGAVADSFFVIFRVGATMELGRSGRPMMMSAGAGAAATYGVIDNDRQKFPQH